jgi:hypothetical protein
MAQPPAGPSPPRRGNPAACPDWTRNNGEGKGQGDGEEMREPELTAERLRELIHYDAATGNFTRLVATSRIPRGAVAGRGTHTYYWRISVDGREYKAHRLAWLWMTGKWPLFFIDHINMDKADNRWCNLREATKAQNMVNTGRRANNSSSGFKNIPGSAQIYGTHQGRRQVSHYRIIPM